MSGEPSEDRAAKSHTWDWTSGGRWKCRTCGLRWTASREDVKPGALSEEGHFECKTYSVWMVMSE